MANRPNTSDHRGAGCDFENPKFAGKAGRGVCGGGATQNTIQKFVPNIATCGVDKFARALGTATKVSDN